MLYIWNKHSIISQLYFNKNKTKNKKTKLMWLKQNEVMFCLLLFEGPQTSSKEIKGTYTVEQSKFENIIL